MGKIMLNEIDYSGGNANVIRLTQAEYDALPPSKLTDNNVYMITDVNGDGSQFQPVIYSEDEREIGVWVDGKPLYQKTVDFSSNPIELEENQWIDTPLSSIGIENIVDVKASTADGSTISWLGANRASTYVRLESIRSTNITITNFTIQYTKTTDTAGSGTWTPQGVPAVHYSTDEQVVGTWIDGSTVYEKTYSGSLTSGDIVLEHFENKMPVESSGWLKNGNGYGIILGAFIQNSQNWWSALHINPNNDLVIIHGSELNSGNYYITVKYIKSSQGGN